MARITKNFLATLAGANKVVAKEILSTLSFPEQIDRLGEALGAVEGHVPDMRMTCPSGIARWESWAVALPELREKAGALERESDAVPPTTRKNGNPWLRRSPPQPVLAFLWISLDSDPADEEAVFGLNALKGLLLAAYAAKALGKMTASASENLDRLCGRIRRVYAGERHEYRSYAPLLPQAQDRDQWLTALEQARMPPSRYSLTRTGLAVPAEFNWLDQARRLSESLSLVHWSDGAPKPSSGQPRIVEPREEDAGDGTMLTAHKPRFRVHAATARTPLADVDVEALDPEIESAVQLEGVAAGEESAAPLAAAIEVRHTNWKTGRDAQRLPWDWAQLNWIETRILTEAMARASEASAQLGAALAWLLLVTGQYLDAVLQSYWLSEAPGGFSRSGHWIRPIPIPDKAFVPNEAHRGLRRHVEYVELTLPVFPAAIHAAMNRTAGSRDAPKTVGEALGLDVNAADSILRRFLADVRAENSRRVRLQPGRIRRVLANTLMQVTQDKVLTHLLAGLSIEEPPTGVYYTTYNVTVLQDAYVQAMERIFA